MQTKTQRSGFTLLEMLVVVLIIAILAAIALPQYQRTVLKSRFASMMPIAKTLAENNEAYYLEHGEYAEDPQELPVQGQRNYPDGTQIELGNEEQHQYVRVEKDGLVNALMVYQKHSPNFAGETHCEALLGNEQADWLCKESLHGTYVGQKYGYAIYSLSEETIGTLARTYYDITTNATYSDGDICQATQGSYKCNGNFTSNSKCIAYGVSSNCKGGNPSYYFDYSFCESHAADSCSRNNYKNSSQCTGDMYSCYYSDYTDHSSCVVTSNGCFGSTFAEYSYCEGKGDLSCAGNTFTDHSICYARVKGACANGTYDETSYCAGDFCPNGAPSDTPGKIWYRGTGTEWPSKRASELIDKPAE